MQKIDYADEPTQKYNTKGKVGSALFGFLNDLANSKEAGQKLPKALDKIAGLVIKGKKEGMSIAEETAKEQIKIKLPLIIMGVIITILVIIIINKK